MIGIALKVADTCKPNDIHNYVVKQHAYVANIEK